MMDDMDRIERRLKEIHQGIITDSKKLHWRVSVLEEALKNKRDTSLIDIGISVFVLFLCLAGMVFVTGLLYMFWAWLL